MSLDWGLHFENHCSKEITLPSLPPGMRRGRGFSPWSVLSHGPRDRAFCPLCHRGDLVWSVDVGFYLQMSKGSLFLVTWIVLLKSSGRVSALLTGAPPVKSTPWPRVSLFGEGGECGSSQAI